MFKNLSFGKLMGIFGGVLLLLIVVTVIIVKASSTAPAPVQRRPAVIDPAVQERKAQEEAAAAEATSKAAELQSTMGNVLAMQNQLAGQNAATNQRLDGMNTELQALSARLEALEASKAQAAAAKPKRPSRDTPLKQLARSGRPLGSSSGYEVRATVGDRAWIQAGDREVSVTAGDALPPTPTLRVRAVESNSGVVITSVEPSKK
jgi:hypothetical protein